MKEVTNIILEAIESYNEILDEKVDISAGSDTVLFGNEGGLDSVDFVSLIVDIEQAVEDEYGKHIAIANVRAMSQNNSPFRTVGSLAEYVNKLLED